MCLVPSPPGLVPTTQATAPRGSEQPHCLWGCFSSNKEGAGSYRPALAEWLFMEVQGVRQPHGRGVWGLLLHLEGPLQNSGERRPSGTGPAWG